MNEFLLVILTMFAILITISDAKASCGNEVHRTFSEQSEHYGPRPVYRPLSIDTINQQINYRWVGNGTRLKVSDMGSPMPSSIDHFDLVNGKMLMLWTKIFPHISSIIQDFAPAETPKDNVVRPKITINTGLSLGTINQGLNYRWLGEGLLDIGQIGVPGQAVLHHMELVKGRVLRVWGDLFGNVLLHLGEFTPVEYVPMKHENAPRPILLTVEKINPNSLYYWDGLTDTIKTFERGGDLKLNRYSPIHGSELIILARNTPDIARHIGFFSTTGPDLPSNNGD